MKIRQYSDGFVNETVRQLHKTSHGKTQVQRVQLDAYKKWFPVGEPFFVPTRQVYMPPKASAKAQK